MTELVKHINSGTGYCVDVKAEYTEQLIDELEDISGQGLRVDVVTEDEETLNETLAVEDRVSLNIRIWMRKKVAAITTDEIDPLKLAFRQIYQRVNNFNSSDRRVMVWECDYDSKEVPDKDILRQSHLFVASLLLRVEVEASA